MNDFIEDKWDNLISDITLSQKQHYSSALIEVNRDLIHTYRVYGSKSGDAFLLTKDKNAEFVEKIWEKKAYKKAQGKTGSQTDSSAEDEKTANTIWIYNGSKITGLAAKYQKKFEELGYTVSGVGNATGETRTSTIIYIKKKGMAKPFKKYFKNPSVQVTENTSSGADIEIVLGTEDDLS
jgi:hypothetical protein